MTATEVRTDQKAGWCSMCRGGSHAICSAPKCACPGKSHPHRPSARPQEAPVPAAAARPVAAVPSTVVRWEDPPPARTVRRSFDPRVLAELERNPGRWARVDNLQSKSGAYTRVRAFNAGKYAPVAPPLWEAAGRATPTGSAFWLRFVGPEA